jgi:hypothetical protein
MRQKSSDQPENSGDGRERRLRLGRWQLPAWAPAVLRPIGVYLAARLVVFVALWSASRLVPSTGLATMVSAWDGGWYLATARDGYPTDLEIVQGKAVQSTIAFFPLYPLCIRALHAVFGLSYQAAGLLVAGLAGIVAVVLLRVLLDRLWGSEAADRGVVLFCFFPGALALSLTYSEALMLALTIGCLLALVSGRWVSAGVLAALATACRPNAIVLVVACGWASFTAIRAGRDWRSLAAPLLSPVGFIAFQGYLWAHTGTADAWWRTQREGWGERLAPGATWDKIAEFIEAPLVDVNITVAMAGIVFIAVSTVLLVRARPPATILVYTAGIVLLALLSQTLGPRPRFILTAFPLVVVVGRWLRGSTFALVVGCSATVLGSFAIVSVASLLATP